MKNKEKYDIRYMTFNVSQNQNGTIKSIDIYYDVKRIKKMKFLSEISVTQAMNAIGEWLEEEYKPATLTDKEEAYLSAVIKPFREEVESIKKIDIEKDEQQLQLQIPNGLVIMDFPLFKKGAMYRGMEEGREYTLEELGL